MRYLLDTNVWIGYLKGQTPTIAARLKRLRPLDIATCAIVRAELMHGAEKYGKRERRIELVTKTLAPFVSLPFDDAAAECYATVRHELEATGKRGQARSGFGTLGNGADRPLARKAGLPMGWPIPISPTPKPTRGDCWVRFWTPT